MPSTRPTAQTFRLISRDYAGGELRLAYAFDDGPELVEVLQFPGAPATFPEGREQACQEALALLHGLAGVSYYKALLPPRIEVEGGGFDPVLGALLDEVYLHGLGEFAHQNGLDLRGRIRFPVAKRADGAGQAPALGLARRALVAIGGGKDSLVSIEMLKAAGEPVAVAWVGASGLIQACADATGLPQLNIQRQLAPGLFELNRQGAWNGHIPVTAINSAILAFAALLYGYDEVVFSNEASASVGNLQSQGLDINHQWSKGLRFESLLADYLGQRVASDLHYYSLLRPWSEMEVTRRFASLTRYHALFSSCNRNFRILGERPSQRWCGQCPKCRFVFLALAPFLSKPALLAIFGRNLLDEAEQIPGFEALIEFRAHKPFECVGEARESLAALEQIAARADWAEDAVIVHYRQTVRPLLPQPLPALDTVLSRQEQGRLPSRITPA